MKKRKIIAVIMVIVILSLTFAGCSGLKDVNLEGLNNYVSSIKGELTGNSFTIDTFDNFGNLTMKTHGDKINISPKVVQEYEYNTNGGWGYTNTVSSVIDITIDGNQIASCGDTCIFYGDGLKPDYTFKVSEINSNATDFSDNTYVAGIVNSIKNKIGKPMVCVIKSQTGCPIYVFSGNSVNWEVPKKLPKFTKISIDGKPLYIHRANFQIIDKDLL